MNQVVIFVCLLVATIGSCSPVSGEKCSQVQIAQHDFDLGSLMSCAVPPTGSLVREGSCPNVDYAVPAVTLQDADSHLTLIRSTVTALRVRIAVDHAMFDSTKAEACEQEFKEELCSLFFPRCSSDRATVDVSFNCTRAVGQCPDGFDVRFCPKLSGYGDVYPIEPCKQKVQQVPLGNCAMAVDQTLPSWLALQVKAIEGYTIDTYDYLNGTPQRDCADLWGNYTCQSVGRCWAQGCRLEHINSMERCNKLDSCMHKSLPEGQYQSLSMPLACTGLPMEVNRPVTTATVITDPTTETPPEATTQQSVSTSSQIVIVLPTSASSPSVQGITTLLVLTAVLLSCLWAL